MLRAALALACSLALAVVTAAAPAPPPSEKERIAKLWGAPEGAGEFELEGKQLTLRTTVGKANHSFSWGDRLDVPRTARAVTGDFEITVRVLDAAAPLKEAKYDSGSADAHAGLYVRGGASSLRYSLCQSYQKFNGARPDLQRALRIEATYPRGGASGQMNSAPDGKSTCLRLTRKGDAITMSHSFDGEKWSAPNNPFRNIDMSIPDEVTVGVFLSHTTYQFAHATFDGFAVTKPKDAK